MNQPQNDLAFLEKCFSNAPIGMAIVGLEGQWLKVNPTLCEMVGYTEAEMLATNFQNISHPRDLERDLSGMAALLAGNISRYHAEKRYFRKNGAIIRVDVSASLIREKSGRPQCFVAHITDISMRKRVEFERDTFFELNADMACVMLPNGILGKVNRAWTEVLGWTAEELTEQPFINFVHPDDRATTLAEMEKTSGGTSHAGFINRCGAKDGAWHWIEWSGGIAQDHAVYCIGRDITKRINAETRLREFKEDLQDILDHVPAMVAYWDADMRNRYGNNAYIEWFGVSPQTMHGKHIREVLGDALFEKNRPYIEAALQGKTQLFERALVDSHGRLRHTQAVYLPDREGDRVRGFYVMVTDITSRKHFEDTLAAEKERFRTTLTAIGDGVITTDRHGVIDFMNPAAEALTRTPAAGALGCPLEQVVILDDNAAQASLAQQPEAGPAVLSARKTPIVDESGTYHGAAIVLRDRTEADCTSCLSQGGRD